MDRSLTIQLENIFDDVQHEIAEELGTQMDRIAKEAVKQLRQTSPRSGRNVKHYADGWTKKVIKATSRRVDTVIVYNRMKPGLTHLLNNGYVKVTGGREPGDGHITDANDWARAELIKAVEGIGG